MPVKAVGKNIVEVATGKVVGHSSSHKKAQSAANMRNMAHAVKQGKLSKEAFQSVKDKAGNTEYLVQPNVDSESTFSEVAGTNNSQVEVTPVTSYKGTSGDY